MRGPLSEPTQEASRRSGDAPALSTVGSLVRQHDRDRFQTVLFAPAAERETLFALYAFNYEIARVRESVTEPMLGLIRLQWWRDVIDAAYSGATPRRHDIVGAVTAAIRSHRLNREHFERLIATRERDVEQKPPENLAALEDYAEGSSSRLIRLALEALTAATPEAEAAATEIGIAYALTGLIRAMPVHAANGRIIIPAEIAAAAGLDPADYLKARATSALRRAVEILAENASKHLAAARNLRRRLPRAALPALLPARIASTTLRRLRRARFDPFAGVGESDPLQSWRLAFAVLLGRF